MAFEGLEASQQAHFFIDINHEQKSVKRGLLHELFSELNWDAEDEAKRVGAIVSKAIQALNDVKDSPLYDRILLTDSVRDYYSDVFLLTAFLESSNRAYSLSHPKWNMERLWTGDNDKTLRRTRNVIVLWFNFIKRACH